MSKPNDIVRAIFEAALALKTDAERAEYLARACPDADLRREVESLLEAHCHPDSVFDEGTITLQLPPTEAPGTRIGRYKLLQQIGEGGMGIVYMAEQEEPVRRRVALKIIKLGMDTRSVVARFEAERQALALMDHPNIAKVLDGGATDSGRPYFVMELVQGVPITVFCDKTKLSARERLKLFIQVCQAIQSAHQKGIIHRDIKPSNVLVTLHDGVPVPKVIDFGIAKATNQKLTEKTLFTNFASMIGTPAYMSPEQAEMSGLDTDTRTDIYALGVLLYELLTGSTPFPEKRLRSLAYGEMQRVILEEEPERPSTRLSTMANEQKTIVARNCGEELASLSNLLRGDLDWIVMKCLEKDRQRRYETANGLAADLKRHLDNEPVVARPPSAGYKLQKAISRNKLAFASGAAVMGALLIGIGVSTWEAAVASRARSREREANQQLRSQIAETEAAKQRADSARQQADESARSESEQRRRIGTMLETMQLQKAEDLLSAQQSAPGVAYLGRMLRDNPSNAVAAARLASAILRPFATPLTEPIRHESLVRSAQFSPDGLRLLTVSDKMARVWDARTGQPLTEPLRHEEVVWSAEFSPDGLSVVTASEDKTAKLWDARTGRPLAEPLRHEDKVWSAEFSPDGSMVLTASEDKTARVWDARTGQALTKPLTHIAPVLSAHFSPDGSRIVTVSAEDGAARVWDARTGQSLIGAIRNVIDAQFSPDGLRLVTAGAAAHVVPGGAWFQAAPVNNDIARVWDARTGLPLTEPLRHEAKVTSARFSPGGSKVVTASFDKTARVWDARTGLPLTGPLKHELMLLDAEFSPDGSRVVTASLDNTARVWDAYSGLALTEPLRHEGAVSSALFSPDGWMIVTASEDKTVRVWDVSPGVPLTEPLQHQQWLTSAEFSPNGLKVVTACQDNTARLWDARTGLPLGEPLRHQGDVRYAQFSPDGLTVVTASSDKTARLWDVGTGKALGEPFKHEGPVGFAQFSADGLKVVTGSEDHTARVWDVHKSVPLTEPLRHQDEVRYVQFSPDGLRVVTASGDKTARVWDARTGQPLTDPLRHEGGVNSARFSTDGLKVVTASGDKTARVWDARTGVPLAGPMHHDNEVSYAEFSPDGSRIVSASRDMTAQVWDARTGLPLYAPLRHKGQVMYAQFSPDGWRIVTASVDMTAQVWDARTGLPLTDPLVHKDAVLYAQFSSDGSRVVTTSLDKTARVWEVPTVPVPVPTWFLDWAEARVGRQFGATNEGHSIEINEQRRRTEQAQSRIDTNLFTRIAQWVQADPSIRTISPMASLTTREYVSRRIAEKTESSLREAILLSPKNSLAWAWQALLVSRQIAETTMSSEDVTRFLSPLEIVAWAWQALQLTNALGHPNDLLVAQAEASAKRALLLDPNQAEAWQAIGTVQWLKNRPTEALASLDRALALHPDTGETWELKGDILEHEERHAEALEAYNRRLALCPLTDNKQGCARFQALDKHAAVCRKMGRWSDAVADLRLGGVPARDPAADPELVDLSAFYNIELGGGDLATMLTGIRTLAGTQFDARGCLFLASGKFFPKRVPDQMLGIPVAAKGQRIHFLHGTFWGVLDPMGTPIGKYVMHFADGTSIETPLVLGRDVLDSTHPTPVQGSQGGPAMVWAVQDPKAGPGDEPDHLYLTTWDNPHPETEIVSLDFVSFRTAAAPFLVAVTVE